MTYETVLYEVKDRIATITINRPDKMNALNQQVLRDLLAAVEAAGSDEGVQVVVLTGAGEKAFAAGADIGELAKLDPMGAIALARRGQALTRRIEQLGKPVIAAVNGFALGGGCELAMACTLRVAADTARMGQPEVNLGIIPGYGGTQRLARLVGKGRALDIVLTGRMVGAEEALQIGLVNRVAPAAGLGDEVRKLAGTLMEKGPAALRFSMEAVDGGLERGMAQALEWEAHLFGLVASTEDMKEGLHAFLEKRKPAFRGK